MASLKHKAALIGKVALAFTFMAAVMLCFSCSKKKVHGKPPPKAHGKMVTPK